MTAPINKAINSNAEISKPSALEPTRAKWAVLSAMRFFLAMVVMFAHFAAYGFGINHRPLLPFSATASVLGFFLISGYSIAYSLKRTQSGFYRRRFLRIYPLYVLSVMFAEALILCLGKNVQVGNTRFIGAGIRTCIGNIFLLQGFLCITITFNGPLWSLGVEWFYYLLAPLLKRLGNTLVIVAILSAITYVYRWGFDRNLLYGHGAFVYCWAWLIGFILYNSRNDWRIVLLMFTGTFVYMYGPKPGSVSVTFPYICAAIGISASWNISLPTYVETLMIHLGDLSYPIYLFHMPILILSCAKFHANNWLWLTVICLIASEILFQVVDVYLKKRFLSPLILGVKQSKRINNPA